MSVTVTTILAKVGISAASKTVQKVAKEPESIVKWILYPLLIILLPVLMISVIISSVVSGVQGYASTAMDDFMSSGLYQKIQNINSFYEFKIEAEYYPIALIENNLLEYVASLLAPAEETEADTEEQQEQVELTDEEILNSLTEEEKKAVLSTNYVTFDIKAPNLAYTLAYITHCEDVQSKWGNVFALDGEADNEVSINSQQIRTFYDNISSVERRSETDENGEIHVTYYLAVLSPEEVAAMYWPDDAQTEQMYIDSYHLFCEIYDISEDMDYGLVDSNFSVPLYFQTDYKHIDYGRGTIASSGCAPTAIAMCLSYLTGQSITPDVVVAWTGDRYYNYGPGGGSYWSIFPACANRWGCTSTQVNSSDISAVKDALSNGNPVIASMGSGHFTSSGHFIVLCGMTDDGKLVVNDPSRSNYTKHGAEVPAEWVFSESKGYFIIRGGQ